MRAAADVLLWRNKKISSGVLGGATAIWGMFEWLNYHFLSLVCLALALGMTLQFLLSNASGFMNRLSSLFLAEFPLVSIVIACRFLKVSELCCLGPGHHLMFLIFNFQMSGLSMSPSKLVLKSTEL